MSDIAFVSYNKASLGEVVDLYTIPPGVFVLIGNVIYKVLEKDNSGKPIIQCAGFLRGENPGCRLGDRAMVTREAPYPAVLVGCQAAAYLLVEAENA